MPAVTPQRAKYIQLLVLALATIVAGVELGLTIYERVHINAYRGTAISHRYAQLAGYVLGPIVTIS